MFLFHYEFLWLNKIIDNNQWLRFFIILKELRFHILKDLNDLGQTNITVSEPIVPFLETIVPDSSMSSSKIDSEHETVNALFFQFTYCSYYFSNAH